MNRISKQLDYRNDHIDFFSNKENTHKRKIRYAFRAGRSSFLGRGRRKTSTIIYWM